MSNNNNSTNNIESLSEYEQMVKLTKDADKTASLTPVIVLEKVKKALEIALRLDDKVHIYKCKHATGAALFHMGQIEKSIEASEDTLEFVRQHFPNNTYYLSRAYSVLGSTHLKAGKDNIALELLLIALSFKCDKTYTDTSNALAVIYYKREEKAKALEYWENGIKYIDKKKNALQYAYLAHNIALVHSEMGNIETAKQRLKEIIQLLEKDEETKAEGIVVSSIYALGNIYAREKNYEEAFSLFQDSIELAENQSLTPLLIDAYYGKARLYFEQGKDQKGIESLEKILQYKEEFKSHQHNEDILLLLKEYYSKTDNVTEALKCSEQLYDSTKEKLKTSKDKEFKKIINEREKEIQLLESKNEEIEKHNTILSQFAYVISHDLREPVRGISGFSKLLNKKFKDKLAETGSEYIDFILSETDNINTKLARLLEYTSLKKASADDIIPLDIQEIVQRQKMEFESVCQLGIECNSEQFNMYQNHGNMLIYELISNAVKFRKDKQYCRIEINSESKNGYKYLSIKDFGAGIAEEYHQQIFKIFKQLDKQTEGAGLGLAICERIVGFYNGKIWLESVPDEYSIFHISIPQ